MAKKCDICGKKPVAGNLVSHSNRKTRRRFVPNLQKVTVRKAGTVKKLTVCTRCIRSGHATTAV